MKGFIHFQSKQRNLEIYDDALYCFVLFEHRENPEPRSAHIKHNANKEALFFIVGGVQLIFEIYLSALNAFDLMLLFRWAFVSLSQRNMSLKWFSFILNKVQHSIVWLNVKLIRNRTKAFDSLLSSRSLKFKRKDDADVKLSCFYILFHRNSIHGDIKSMARKRCFRKEWHFMIEVEEFQSNSKLQTWQITSVANYFTSVQEGILITLYQQWMLLEISSRSWRKVRIQTRFNLFSSFIRTASLYSKHPLAFSVEQRKPFEAKVFRPTWDFCALPFTNLYSGYVSDTRDKKFKLYVFLHLE